MVRKTKEEAQQTRDRILDAAELVFQQRGVASTSLNEIATAAGVTRGAVYWHFENKADLYDAMLTRVIDPAESEFNTLLSRHGDDALAALRELILGFLTHLTADPRHQRVFEVAWHKCEYTGDMAKARDKHLECGSHYMGIIDEAIRRAQRLGQVPAKTDRRAAAIGLVAVVDGLMVNWTLDPGRFDLAKVAPTVIDIYFAGLQSNS